MGAGLARVTSEFERFVVDPQPHLLEVEMELTDEMGDRFCCTVQGHVSHNLP